MQDIFRQGIAELARADTIPATDGVIGALNPAESKTGIAFSIFRLTGCPPAQCLRVMASGEGEPMTDHPDRSVKHTPIVFVEGIFL
jgi:hypothetical protein